MKIADPSGLSRRIESNRSRLYRVAYAWCWDRATADDLAQECLARALHGAEALRDPERLESWLYGILNNCWREHLRRRRPDVELEEDLLVCDCSPETESYRQQVVARVRKAIACLPAGQRKTVTLVDLEGRTYAEVAAALEVPIGTVMSRLNRARRRLQRHLADVAPTRY